jgi:hypothetical protein
MDAHGRLDLVRDGILELPGCGTDERIANPCSSGWLSNPGPRSRGSGGSPRVVRRRLLTISPSLELRFSRRIREEFENGRDYYALERREVRLPAPPHPPPSAEFLEWHGDSVFRR